MGRNILAHGSGGKIHHAEKAWQLKAWSDLMGASAIAPHLYRESMADETAWSVLVGTSTIHPHLCRQESREPGGREGGRGWAVILQVYPIGRPSVKRPHNLPKQTIGQVRWHI